MKIAVLNPKGGSGKTTLALNLAQGLSLKGKRVLVVDCDPQGSALAWAHLAEETAFTVGRSLTQGFDYTLMDMPPTFPKDLPKVDLYLVPTTLDGVSYSVFLRFTDRLKEEGKAFLPIVNRYNKYRAEHRQRLTDDELKQAILIPERAAFASCYGEGLTVYDMNKPHVIKARNDIERLIEALLQQEEPHKGQGV